MSTPGEARRSLAAYRGSEPFVFVSYAHADWAVVSGELEWLSRRGVRLWYDEGIRVGQTWPDEIGRAIEQCAAVLVWLSPRAAQSEHVRDEILMGLDLRKPIVLCHLEETTLPPGMRLRLASMQAILRHETTEADFRSRLVQALPPGVSVRPASSFSPDVGDLIGIDFGTRNSVMAYYTHGGGEGVILNRDGERSTPTVVALSDDGEWLCGAAAIERFEERPESAAISIKRRLGSDESFRLCGREFRAVELAAAFLRRLREDAEASLRRSIHEVVATVPVQFSWRQRRDLAEAYRLAGFEITRMVPESTAVALAYSRAAGISFGSPENRWTSTYAIADLGAGTFDVSVVAVVDDAGEWNVHVEATGGDNALGGDDLDAALANHCLRVFEGQHGVRVTDDEVRRLLLAAVERAKLALCERQAARVRVRKAARLGDRDLDLVSTVLPDQFAEIARPFLERAVSICRQTRERSDEGRFDAVLLAGLSTRVPGFREAVGRVFDAPVMCQIDPSEAVALGAAIQGAIIRQRNERALLVDVTSHGLAVELSNGTAQTVVRRDGTIPRSDRRRFRLAAEANRAAVAHLYQVPTNGEWRDHYLGTLVLPLDADGADRRIVELTCDVAVDGRLDVALRAVDSDSRDAQRFDWAGERGTRPSLESNLEAWEDEGSVGWRVPTHAGDDGTSDVAGQRSQPAAFYVRRSAGPVEGPFPWNLVEQMISAAYLAPTDEVSRDGATFVSASQLVGVQWPEAPSRAG